MSKTTVLQWTGLIGAVMVAAATAILTHAALPSDLEGVPFSGVFMETLGFPVVAVSYFLLVFTHCAWVVARFGSLLNRGRLQTGLRLGLTFGLLYMLGMQEVVVEATPFETWGVEFVRFQLLMGLGDGVAVTVLCLLVAGILFRGRRQKNTGPLFRRPDRWTLVLVTTLFFLQRLVRMGTNLIDHNFDRFPVPTVLWTLLFGLALGFACTQFRPDGRQMDIRQAFRTGVLAVGINWMIYNSFIGLIFEGMLLPMLLRSGTDVGVLAVSLVLAVLVRRLLNRRHSPATPIP